MEEVTLQNVSHQVVLAKKVQMCRSFWSRLKGLLGTSQLDCDEACWISRCNSIHTFGMKYAIDAYFLNKNNEVVAILKNMKPNRLSRIYFDADSVVEFSANGHRTCQAGDRLALESVL